MYEGDEEKMNVYLKLTLCEYLKVLSASQSTSKFALTVTYTYDSVTVYVGERL